MKRKSGTEYYSFARADWIDSRKSTISWDYGRRHALPIWPEFVAKSCFHNEAFYTHHRPTSTAFELPLSGELLLEHGGEKITVRPGELYILPRANPIQFARGKRRSAGKYQPDSADNWSRRPGDARTVGRTEPDPPRGTAADSRPARTDVPAAPGTGTGIGCGTGRPRAATVHRSRSSDGGAAPSPLADAVRIFEFNLSGPTRLREVAAELKLTEQQLIRLFRKHYDMTPMDFLGELRMRKAAALLRRLRPCRSGRLRRRAVTRSLAASAANSGKDSGSLRCTTGNSDVQAQTGEAARPARAPA